MNGIITGTTSGIGAELNRWFAKTSGISRNPYAGITMYHGNRRDCDDLSTDEEGVPHACTNIQMKLDMTSRQSIERFAESIVALQTDEQSIPCDSIRSNDTTVAPSSRPINLLILHP